MGFGIHLNAWGESSVFHVPEQYRLRTGPLGSRKEDGNNGSFFLPPISMDWMFAVIASDGPDESPWEHVSVHMRDRRDMDAGSRAQRQPRMRVPGWAEMCYIKNIFWDPEDCVIQYHPAESSYVSIHDYVLHLWRPVGIELPTPPLELIGPVTGQRLW